jgi:hypothetical protein
MDDKARFYDPTLGRFIQPDTIIPSFSNPQNLNRYVYVSNNPILNTDPTGHCINLVQCGNEIGNALGFLASQMLSKGTLSDQDFRDAADFAAPAVASGSKESATFAGGFMATWIWSKTLITTSKGDVQVFDETDVNKNGVPEGAALPGAGVSVTHGFVQGLTSAIDYKGGATQGNLSIPMPFCDGACGPYVEGYRADDGRVWGGDIGVEAGLAPTILGAAHTNAKPTSNANGLIPKKLSGPQLLGCRIIGMCGAAF